MTPEEKAAEDKRRREARKNRILGNPSGRIGFIADQVKDPSHTPPKKIDDDDDGDDIGSDGILEHLTQQQINALTADQTFTGQGQRPTRSNKKSSSASGSASTSTVKKSTIKESFRWIGAITFGMIFAYNALIMCSQVAVHPLQKYIGTADLKSDDISQILYIQLPTIVLWLAWEYLLGYDSRRYSFFTHIRSDVTLVAFFYAVSVDLLLRFVEHPLLHSVRQFIPSDVHTGQLISGMYIPLFISFAGQLSNSIIAKNLPLAMMGDMVGRVVDGVLQFLIVIVSLLVCVDWWGCASCPCQPAGLLYIIANKSRGLMIWAHICNGFASRVLG
ncbi:hypothetical protein SAMD00019534_071540 [Acytostelium subglobosum LB1]|uniref:hypothetical protein n=1 Tax=Acytostelium subglobosum LB1 TaxID=1410327 RepID=UPI000644AC22|nr:hypothetical protein SAMD00019534_071540 [Acytostelium subglobosum LB1]GAM23979.1 hypothetical protein SAMD00019534_071540 [Acytostelium subglobosum LB1]|eukprot:XP_012753015.1 hypothetical protein SAMD00019534_071540 [Acytostelium subglobosum LB1]